MYKNKTIISWALVILWMSVIFYLSHQPATKSNDLSTGITQRIIRAAEDLIEDLDIDTKGFNHIIRKMAHFLAYFILGVLVINALGQNNEISIKWIIISILICTLYAISDEVHQAFIPGRGPGILDVVIDTIGASTGILLYNLLKTMFHVEH